MTANKGLIKTGRIQVGVQNDANTIASTLSTLLVGDINPPDWEVEKEPLENNTGSGLPYVSPLGGSSGTVSFSLPLAHTGRDVLPYGHSSLFLASGMTVLTGQQFHLYTSVLDSSAGHFLTIRFRDGGRTVTLTGCQGTFSLAGEPRGTVSLQYTFTGKMHSVIYDSAFVPAPDPIDYPVVQMRGGALTLRQVGLTGTLGNPLDDIINLTGLSCDLGKTVSRPDDMLQDDGRGDARITAYAPTCEISYIPKSANTGDTLMRTAIEYGGTYQIGLVLPSPQHVDISTEIELRNVSFTGGSYGDSEGIRTETLTGVLVEDQSGSANLGMAITFRDAGA